MSSSNKGSQEFSNYKGIDKCETDSNDRQPLKEEGQKDSNNTYVYIGNLSWAVRWQTLKDHMRLSGGNVLHADVFIDGRGLSRGCGLVEYETPEEAREAIKKMNGTELQGRKIFVREDAKKSTSGQYGQQHEYRGGRGRGGGRGSYDRRNDGYQTQPRRRRNYESRGGRSGSGSRHNPYPDAAYLKIMNLPSDSKLKEIQDLLNDDEIFLSGMGSSGDYDCGAHFAFKRYEDAVRALDKLNNYDYRGVKLKVLVERA